MDDDRYSISIGPDKTYALIVGIDYYEQLGNQWNLVNPVHEALQLARWLLERGVPASRIQCFLGQSAEAAGVDPLYDRCGARLDPRRPTMQKIQEALLGTSLPELPEGSTLIFYWAGHGQLGRDSRQLLQDAEYSDKVRRVFDFAEIKRALQSQPWERLTRQILLVNACASLDTSTDQTFATVPLTVQALGDYRLRQQFVVYAAPPGEYAMHGPEGRPGPFFEKIFKVLRSLGNSGSFPEERLCQEVDRELEAMHPKPRTERVRFNGDCSEWHFDDDLTRVLYRWLSQEIDVSMNRFQGIFREWFNDQKGDPETMADLVRRLVSQSDDRLDHPLGRVVEFFLHAVEEFKREDLFERLQKLIQQPNRYQLSGLPEQLTIPGLRRVRQDVERDRKRGRPPYYLSFYLTSGSDSADLLHCTAHDGQFNEIKFDHDQVRIPAWAALEETFKRFYLETIRSVLQRQPGYSAQDCDVHFRFYLPAEAMSQIPVHRLLDPRRDSSEITIAQFSPLTLSSYERASGKSGLDSLSRWEALFERNKSVPGTDAQYQSISPGWPDVRRHKAVEKRHWLGTDQPPTLKFLNEMIGLGVPFLIWPWQATDQWPDVEEKVKASIGPTPLRDAPTCFPEFREEYSMENDQLVVFWDDYERNGLKHLQGEEYRPMDGE
jgi:hypothetical protein